MIWGLLIFALTLAGKLWFDMSLYRKVKANRHKLGPVIVLVCLTVASWLAGWRSAPMLFFGFWALFDTIYATTETGKPFYIGNMAFLDRLQRKYRIIQALKYLLFIASIIFYILVG